MLIVAQVQNAQTSVNHVENISQSTCEKRRKRCLPELREREAFVAFWNSFFIIMLSSSPSQTPTGVENDPFGTSSSAHPPLIPASYPVIENCLVNPSLCPYFASA